MVNSSLSCSSFSIAFSKSSSRFSRSSLSSIGGDFFFLQKGSGKQHDICRTDTANGNHSCEENGKTRRQQSSVAMDMLNNVFSESVDECEDCLIVTQIRPDKKEDDEAMAR
mmetsp:Transcript_42068/g.70077  ORF Transcript_42068/g.70077 Transcript_42068/m.70077 type:complete len:111 (+) Transcript_42068:457-789(+)